MMNAGQMFGIPKQTEGYTQIWLNGFVATASSDNHIPIFSELTKNDGAGFTWVRDTILGDSIQVNYDMVGTANVLCDNNAGNIVGISLNRSDDFINTSITAIPSSMVLAMVSNPSNGYLISMSATVILKAGDRLRVQTNSAAFGSFLQFRIVRVG